MDEITVSIIVPVYNVEEYLRDCLDSILQQDFTGYEVVCVNDASPDGSKKILSEYAANYDQIKICNHSENRGLSAARNTGLMNAKGKYVLFVDSDDMIAPGMLQDLYNAAEKKCTDIICFDIAYLCEEADYRYDYLEKRTFRKYYGVYSGKELFCLFVDDCQVKSSAWQWFIRKDFLKDNDIKFYEGIIHEDELFSFLCFMNAKRAADINEKYYIYRQRNGSIMGIKDHRRAESVFVILIQILTYWNSHAFTDRENQAIGKYFRDLISCYDSYSCFGQKVKKLSVGGYVEKLVYEVLQRRKNRWLFLDEEQIEQIKNADKVIVFGAGRAAADIVNMLQEKKIGISVIAVSNLDRNPELFGGIKVDSIENVSHYMKDAMVIIGVTKRYSQGICEKLRQLGYSNIIIAHETNEEGSF